MRAEPSRPQPGGATRRTGFQEEQTALSAVFTVVPIELGSGTTTGLSVPVQSEPTTRVSVLPVPPTVGVDTDVA